MQTKSSLNPQNKLALIQAIIRMSHLIILPAILMHVGRDKVLPIALNHSGKTKVVSPAYTIFRLKEGDTATPRILLYDAEI
jgi:hypothetical protein